MPISYLQRFFEKHPDPHFFKAAVKTQESDQDYSFFLPRSSKALQKVI